ncbi:MAG: phosphatidylglycerophosphatase A [Parcubacteria group bacterium]|jgi:phosphatidylglycerophosphatase A
MTKEFKRIFLSLGGIGFSKYAPGTLGSVVSAIFLFLLKYSIQSLCVRIFAALAVFIFIYILSIKYVESYKANGKVDHSWIITDEFLGMMIAGIPFLMENNSAGWNLIIGFALFRFFDVLKFWPICVLDKINTPRYVIFDDILAGVFAAIFTGLIRIT